MTDTNFEAPASVPAKERLSKRKIALILVTVLVAVGVVLGIVISSVRPLTKKDLIGTWTGEIEMSEFMAETAAGGFDLENEVTFSGLKVTASFLFDKEDVLKVTLDRDSCETMCSSMFEQLKPVLRRRTEELALEGDISVDEFYEEAFGMSFDAYIDNLAKSTAEELTEESAVWYYGIRGDKLCLCDYKSELGDFENHIVLKKHGKNLTLEKYVGDDDDVPAVNNLLPITLKKK